MKKLKLVSISSEEVQKIKSEQGWSQRQAARILGISKTTWLHYERNGISNGIAVARLKKAIANDKINLNMRCIRRIKRQ